MKIKQLICFRGVGELGRGMKIKLGSIITFTFYIGISYLIVGVLKNGFLVGIKWVEDVTILDKLREYYVRMAVSNIIPTLILAVIIASLVKVIKKVLLK